MMAKRSGHARRTGRRAVLQNRAAGQGKPTILMRRGPVVVEGRLLVVMRCAWCTQERRFVGRLLTELAEQFDRFYAVHAACDGPRFGLGKC